MISLERLRDFWQRHPDAETSLRAWCRAVCGAEWASLQDARLTFPHADGVRTDAGETLTVFNICGICGNKYRVIARIRYDYQLVNVRVVLTHPEYDKNTWRR